MERSRCLIRVGGATAACALPNCVPGSVWRHPAHSGGLWECSSDPGTGFDGSFFFEQKNAKCAVLKLVGNVIILDIPHII